MDFCFAKVFIRILLEKELFFQHMWTFTTAQRVQKTQKPLELPLTGQSEQKIDAISMQVDEKITQFHQNPIFEAASGGLVLGRGIIALCSRLQLPSWQGRVASGTLRSKSQQQSGGHQTQTVTWMARSLRLPPPVSPASLNTAPIPLVSTGPVERTQKPLVLAHRAGERTPHTHTVGGPQVPLVYLCSVPWPQAVPQGLTLWGWDLPL